MILQRYFGASLSEEDKAQIEKDAKEGLELFTTRLAPFYTPRLIEAAKQNWKADIKYSAIWAEHPLGLRVLLGGGIYAGDVWLHISASYKIETKFVTWKQFSAIKNLFLGEETKAIQCFPPRSEWINDRENVLHLWSNLDNPEIFPDFRILNPINGGRLSI